MKAFNDEHLLKTRWHWPVLVIAILSILAAAFGGTTALVSKGFTYVSILLLMLGLTGFVVAMIIAVFAIILLMIDNIKNIKANTDKQENILGMLRKNHPVLEQISQAVYLSEAAKSIIFHDIDRQSLREVVLDKLHQQDFKTTYELIDGIAQQAEYKTLAEQLRTAADKYHNATEEDRINQVIVHIEKLIEQYQWLKAGAQIENLIKAYPDSEHTKKLRSKLLDKKEQRKKELLSVWDEAVKRQETDRSLEVLKELDLYLTPNEGLALQESARDVFRTKLHNLGVQFSFAVTEKNWSQAYQAGTQIIRDFPNSRMAQEIREKIDILQQRSGG